MNSDSAPLAGFGEFVAARSHVLLRVAWLLTGDVDRAEDLLQVALARTWRHWGRICGGNPEAYVRRVLFRSYLTSWRRRWRVEIPHAVPPERAGPDDVAAEFASRDGVRRALAGLTRRQRAIVIVRYVEDRSVAETAELLGCSQGTVKTTAFRALAALRADPNVRLLLTSGGEETPATSLTPSEGIENHGAY